jgi:putative ABC transport system ATP-binding protein
LPVALIEVDRLTKVYRMGGGDVAALDGLTLAIEAGEAVAVMGPSGSGKSTLMNLLGCLDRPTAGSYRLDGRDVSRLSRRQLAVERNRRIGFVFQGFNLLARATAVENVELPLVYAGVFGRLRRRRALAALEQVGLADRAGHLPSQLSGGQQQRVAIARALVNQPRLLLADEPTGSLDSRASEGVLELLAEVNREGITLVLITHDAGVAQTMRRIVRLHDGRLLADEAVVPPPATLRLVAEG